VLFVNEMVFTFTDPNARRFSIHIPSQVPALYPSAYPAIFHGLSSFPMTRPIAVIQIVTSSSPNSVAHVRTPRTIKTVFRVPIGTSVRRSPKMIIKTLVYNIHR
jgi:hypothetical protein